MEYRKLIRFGKNSFVVSLPKPWVNQNKLVKGDLIYIEESGPTLILSKKDLDKPERESEKIINIDGKDLNLIEREVNSAYIRNFRKIVLKGKEIKGRIKEFQRIIQGLIALEIMEQTTDSIVAKDFLNMDKVSMDELIRKMDVVSRTMLRETITILKEDTYQNINERDEDVNRLYFLLYRSVQYNLENLTKAMKNFKLGAVDLLSLQYVGHYVEGIADEAKRISRFARLLKLPAKEQEAYENFMQRVFDFYSDSMKSVYAKNEEAALKLSLLRRGFNSELSEMEERNKGVEHYGRVVERLRRLVSHIHHLGWTTLTTSIPHNS